MTEESLMKNAGNDDISPQEFEVGRAEFLRILHEKRNSRSAMIRARAISLLEHYEGNPDHLELEVKAQLRINRSDLLRGTTFVESEHPVAIEPKPQKSTRKKIGPVEERILDLIRAEEETRNQNQVIRKISYKNS